MEKQNENENKKEQIIIVIILVIVLIIQIISTYYQVLYYWKLNFNKNHYPIKQLSAKITQHQGVFLILSQITSLIYLFISELQTQRQQQEQQEQDQETYNIISFFKDLLTFLYIFSRGCCYSFAFIKTARVIVAFKKTQITPQSLYRKIFSDEKLMLKIGYFYSFIGFCLLSFVTTIMIQKENKNENENNVLTQFWLFYYHDNRQLIMINSILEEGLYLFLMSCIIINHLDDKLYKLTLIPLAIYMVWFIFASLLMKIPNKLLEIIIDISYLFRAYIMFFYYIVKPINQIEEHPTLYVNSNEIENFEKIAEEEFQGHYKDSIILRQFQEYLKYLDKKQDFQNTFEGYQFTRQKLYEIYLKFKNLINQPAPIDIIIDFLNREFQNNDILKNLDFQLENFNEKLEIHLKNVYFQFKNTMAFQTIKDLYKTQEVAIENFQILGTDLVQFVPQNYNRRE